MYLLSFHKYYVVHLGLILYFQLVLSWEFNKNKNVKISENLYTFTSVGTEALFNVFHTKKKKFYWLQISSESLIKTNNIN
jgi:hypothetical protein